MSNLSIVDHDGVLVVDSRLIAEDLGVQHKNLLETLNAYLEILQEAFGAVAFETREFKTSQGNTSVERFAYLTEDQATLLMTFSRNTPQVIQCKVNLVKAFSKAKHQIAEKDTFDQEYLKFYNTAKMLGQDFNTAIAHYSKWLRIRGVHAPTKQDIVSESDFLQSCYPYGIEKIKASELYSQYVDWCKQNERRFKSQTRFSPIIQRLGCYKSPKTGGCFYYEIPPMTKTA